MSSSSSGIIKPKRETAVTPTQSTTTVAQTMNVIPHIKPIITTAEVSVSIKKESAVIIKTATRRVTLPAKRGRHFDKSHAVMDFTNEEEFKTYVECVQLKNQNVSPCVDRSELKKYPMVFEEWQEHSTGSSTNKRWYRCRRQRGYRRKGLGRDGRPARPKRQLKHKKEYIGCGCQTRFRKTVCHCSCSHVTYFWDSSEQWGSPLVSFDYTFGKRDG